jgi:hypothetical protein
LIEYPIQLDEAATFLDYIFILFQSIFKINIKSIVYAIQTNKLGDWTKAAQLLQLGELGELGDRGKFG